MRITRTLCTIPLLTLLLLLDSPAQPQPGIPVDTSFTIYQAFLSATKVNPRAVLVRPSHPHSVTVQRGIPYARYGERVLRCDLFRPAPSGVYPAVIMIHGGGWASGDRSQNEAIAERLAAEGFLAASIEYRLSPEARFPAALHDLKAAVRWLRANCSAYRVDSSFIALLGFSSGGELAALAGTTNGKSLYEGQGGAGGFSSRVQAVIDIDGVLDFTDPAESGKDTIPGKLSAGARWIGATFRDAPAAWREASPLEHAGRTTPPTLFINSSIARFHAGREEYIAKLKESGVACEVHTIPESPHPFLFFHPWFEPTCRYLIDFLKSVYHRRSGELPQKD